MWVLGTCLSALGVAGGAGLAAADHEAVAPGFLMGSTGTELWIACSFREEVEEEEPPAAMSDPRTAVGSEEGSGEEADLGGSADRPGDGPEPGRAWEPVPGGVASGMTVRLRPRTKRTAKALRGNHQRGPEGTGTTDLG